MFGWSSSPAPNPVAVDDRASQATFAIGRGALTRLLVDRVQDRGHDPFALVMLELTGRTNAGDGAWETLPDAARMTLLQRLCERLRQQSTQGSLDERISVLIVAGLDTRAALEPLRLVLSECCQHSVLADRKCYSVRWRLASAFYPAEGRAPSRLLRDAQAQLRVSPWSDAEPLKRTATTAPSNLSPADRFRLPVAADPLALV